jgi:integrase
MHGGRRVRGLHERTLKDGSTVFEARLRIDGEDRTVRLDADTKSDAVREFENLRADRNRGLEHGNPLLNPLVSEVFEEWYAHIAARVGIADARLRYSEGYASSAPLACKHILKLAPWFGKLRVAEVRTPHLRRLVTVFVQYGYAGSTIAQQNIYVGAMLVFALKQEYIETVPSLPREDRPAAKRKTEPRCLTAEQLVLLLSKADDAYRAVYAAYGYAGLRLQEGLGLRWGDDVDFGADTVAVNGQLSRTGGRYIPWAKYGSEGVIPMLPALKRELLAHRARQAEHNLALVRPGAFVFTHPDGSTYAYQKVSRVLHKAAHAAGLNPPDLPHVTPHDLRHTCGAIAIQNGATIVETAELLRHANVTTTLESYAGLTEEGRGAAVRKLLASGFGA